MHFDRAVQQTAIGVLGNPTRERDECVGVPVSIYVADPDFAFAELARVERWHVHRGRRAPKRPGIHVRGNRGGGGGGERTDDQVVEAIRIEIARGQRQPEVIGRLHRTRDFSRGNRARAPGPSVEDRHEIDPDAVGRAPGC